MSSLQPEKSNIRFECLGEDALLLSWPEKVSLKQHQEIIAVQRMITERFRPLITDTVVAYHTLAIFYHVEKIAASEFIELIKGLINNFVSNNFIKNKVLGDSPETTNSNGHTNAGNLVVIPTYYHPEAGWDLADVAKRTNLTIEQVIKHHTSTSYHAYALGFLPGFCYLASLDNQLILPRRTTPRTQVPAGAVAIAAEQTAVYPQASPGGWHIIGQTPKAMVQKTASGLIPTIKVGDTVRFQAINQLEFVELGGNLMVERK
ncbi:5-oxoprolinase subunit PxpB [Colwellia sp. MEBiC06753]